MHSWQKTVDAIAPVGARLDFATCEAKGSKSLNFSIKKLSRILRTILVILVLIAPAAISANGSPRYAVANHRHAQSGSIAYNRTNRATPEEVGRQSGLKIRETLRGQKQVGHIPQKHVRWRRTEALGERQEPDWSREYRTSALAISTRPYPVREQRVALRPALRGSVESLVRQNERSEEEGLERILDEDDLADRIDRNLLVPLPTSTTLTASASLPENHRFCRPWTAHFLADLARVHATMFHHPIEVTSAVRTVAYQKELMRINGNAAPAEGDIVSPHLTGGTIDLAKQGMSRQEMAWLRSWLLPLQNAGKIDVEEEFEQACFHITVYTTYVPPVPLRRATQPVTYPQYDEPQGPMGQVRTHDPGSLAAMSVRGR